MSGIEDQRNRGKGMLKEVALRYAAQHGLRPAKVEWLELGGDEWWLKIVTEQHSAKIVFSIEEIEDFPARGPEVASSKAKVRNAFANLAM